MKQVLQDFKTGNLRVEEVPAPEIKDRGILVQNHYSCVSAGTEKAVIDLAKKNMVNKARERPDLAKKVINKAKNDGLVSTYQAVKGRLESPSPLGYSCAGEVIEVGDKVENFSRGDLVACGGAGYANHADVVYVPDNLAVKIPDGVSAQDASFATIGSIAMQGVRRAEISPGENVAVLGLGLIGQLTVQILKAYGSPVLGLDIAPSQLEKGFDLGMDGGAVIGQDNVEGAAQQFSNGHGVDAVIIAASTKSNDPVKLAGKITREHGRISAVGQVGMDIPRNLYYDKELDFKISRSYGPGRYDKTYEEKGLSYPIEHVRWTENRNMAEFLRLIGDGRIDLESLRTHQFSINDALNAYELILDNPDNEDFTGILLEYDQTTTHEQRQSLNRVGKRAPSGSVVQAGLVGGGNFAKTTIIPTLSKIDDVNLRAVASATGKTASNIGRKQDCEYVTTDYTDFLEDEQLDLVIVATRNNLHAEIAAEALQKDKNVFVEKPLAISEDGLARVIEAEADSTGQLMVGYNRRFSPLATDLKAQVDTSATPLMANYRVNAESVPADHWVHDPEEGGGRIISEICHFVDFIQFLVGDDPTQVYAQSLPSEGDVIGTENVNIVLDFADGSSATIQYTALGDSSLPKERVEVFSGGEAHLIDNFKYGPFDLKQDKGHLQEYQAFIQSILSGRSAPINPEELASSTLTTLRIHDSLADAEPIKVGRTNFIR